MTITFERKKKQPNAKKMIEYSKRVVKWVVFMWFVGALYGLIAGAYAVITEVSTVENLFNFITLYISAPFSGTIVGYFTKAAFENVQKIKKETDNDG